MGTLVHAHGYESYRRLTISKFMDINPIGDPFSKFMDMNPVETILLHLPTLALQL